MSTSFSVDRFLKTAARLSSDNEHERAIAAKQASALLAQVGLTWDEVLRKGLPAHLSAASAAPTSGATNAFDSVFSGLFNDFFNPPPRAKPAPTPSTERPRYRGRGATIVQGADIPRFIQGHPEVRERTEFKPGQFKMILGVVNEDKNERYDPLVLFNTNSMDLIEEAVKQGTTIGGRVSPASQLGHLPVFMLTVS